MKNKFTFLLLPLMAASALALFACGDGANDGANDSGNGGGTDVPPPPPPPVTEKEIKLDKTDVSLDLYELASVGVVGDCDGVVWSTDNAEIATVDSDGHVAAKGAGECYVIATDAEGNIGKCRVNVVDSGARPELTVSHASLELGKNITQVLDCTLTYKDVEYTDYTVKYGSGDYTIAATYSDGRVTGGRLGDTTVTVTALWRERKVKESLPVSVKQVTLDRKSVTLDMYDEVTLGATAYDKGGAISTRKCDWTTSDDTVVTVADGKVSVVGEGNATVTARLSDTLYATCDVTVEDSGAKPELVLSQTALSFDALGEKTVSASLNYKGNKCDDAVIEFVSEGDIATADGGKITMTDYGKTTVKVTASWRGAELEKTIALDCAALKMDRTSLELDRYDEQTLNPIYRGTTGDAITVPLEWASSDTGVVTVSGGKISVIGVGSAVVSVATGGETAECEVTVTDSGARPVLTLSDTDLTFNLNDEKTVDATLTYKGANCTGAIIRFVSASDIVTVDENGKITAKGYGAATVNVSATWRGATLRDAVSVFCASLIIDKTTLGLDMFDEYTLKPAYRGATGSAITVPLEWASSDTGVVTVSGGKISVIGVGSAVVSVATGGETAECAVTVTDSGARPELVLDSEIVTLLKKGERKTVSGYVAYKTEVYEGVELSCESDKAAVSASGVIYTGSNYGKANVEVSVTWRGAKMSKTALVTVYSEYYNPMSNERLTAAYRNLNITQDNIITFISEDYRSTGGVYAISKNVYDGLYHKKNDYIQIAEQNGIVKETDAVYGWYELDRDGLGLFVGGWYDVKAQWETSTFRIQPMIKEIDGCYFLWMGNMFLFSDPHDGGWKNNSCTQFYWAYEGQGELPIVSANFVVEIDDFIKIQNPVRDSTGSGLVYEITENIYGTFKYTDERVQEGGITFTRIDSESIGLFTDYGKAQYYNADILSRQNGYVSFADCPATGVYAGCDTSTGKYYLWFKSFNEFNYTIHGAQVQDPVMQDKRSTFIWTSVDGKKCEHTVRTNIS